MRAEQEEASAPPPRLRGPWAWIFASALLALAGYLFWVNAGRALVVKGVAVVACHMLKGCEPPAFVPPPRALWGVTSVVLRVNCNGSRDRVERRIQDPLQVEAIVEQAARLRRAPYQYNAVIKPPYRGATLVFYVGEHRLTSLFMRQDSVREQGENPSYYFYRPAGEELARLDELVAPGENLLICPEQTQGH